MLKLLKAYARGASLQLQGDACYYLDKPLSLYVNNRLVKQVKTCVFSLWDLTPHTPYLLKLGDDSLIFTTLKEKKALSVTSFGAVPDGQTDNTLALQKALDSLELGDTLVVNKGVYCTNPLFIKSRSSLYFEEGAVLKGLPKRENYPVLPAYTDGLLTSSWEGEPNEAFASLITLVNVNHVTLYGGGTLDGGATESDWWLNPTTKRIAWRPRTVFISQSYNVDITGLTLCNSPSWTLHTLCSHHLNFYHLTIINPPDSPNTDGFDPEFSHHIQFIGCNISVGDDCVAIKAGKGQWARKQGMATHHLTIEQCLMQNGHAAVAFGSEMSGGISDISVKNCHFEGTDRGIRLKTRRGRGGYVDNLDIKNITMNQVVTPLAIHAYYFCCDSDGKSDYVASKQAQVVNEGTPIIGKVSLQHIKASNAHACAAFVYGLPEQPIKKLSIKNMAVTFATEAKSDYPAMMRDLPKQSRGPYFFKFVDTLELENLTLDGEVWQE